MDKNFLRFVLGLLEIAERDCPDSLHGIHGPTGIKVLVNGHTSPPLAIWLDPASLSWRNGYVGATGLVVF